MGTTRAFVFDVDSTLLSVESLDMLVEHVWGEESDAGSKITQFREITRRGMEGELPIEESLRERLALICAKRADVETVAQDLVCKLSPSVRRNSEFFRQCACDIWVISNGFEELLWPALESLGIDRSQVFANSFVYDSDDRVSGYETERLLAQRNGKCRQLAELKLKGKVHVVGDGITDFEMAGGVSNSIFYAYTENVRREIVCKQAQHVLKSLDEFLYLNKLPMRVSYPKSKIKVLLLENIHSDAVRYFEEDGLQIELEAAALSEAELLKRIGDVSLLGVRSKTSVSPAVLSKAKRLLAIGAFCIGTDQIALEQAAQCGVCVFNAPYSNTRSVVELTLGQIIMLLRQVFDRSTQLHAGAWNKFAKGCHEVRGRRLGIIGYGNIGSQLSVLAEGLGMQVYYYDHVDKLALGNAKKCNSLDELLSTVDIVTVHVDGTMHNQGLIAEREFALMRAGTIFLNISRGKIVDLYALAAALDAGHIAGAAIDVYPQEPKSNTEGFQSVLQGKPNVILTPHIGGSTVEAQQNIAGFVAAKLIDYVNSGNSFGSVNFPKIQLPQVMDAHRLLHIHHNVPGILAKINGVLAEMQINILGQYLKTDEQIGYVITDVDSQYDDKVIERLKSIPETIRLRVLY